MFKIPARIITVDYIGVHNNVATAYRSRAMSELETLYSHMEFQGLKQYKRTITTDENVRILCQIYFGAAQATIIIGADSKISIDEYACFCTAYGVVAGRIIKLEDEVEDAESVTEHYQDDESYRANILVCQKAGFGRPKLIETREVRRSGGSSNETIKNVQSDAFWISEEFVNVPFTDRYPHQPGELCLILVMPLVDYRPTNQNSFCYGMTFEEKFGAWSPEVNMRKIVNRYWDKSVEEVSPAAIITNKYLASTGQTNIITLDANIWDGKLDNKEDTRTEEELLKEIRYNPFRILPIPLDSCFAGYSK